MQGFRNFFLGESGMPEEHRALRGLTHEILSSHGMVGSESTRHPGLSSHYEGSSSEVDPVALHQDLVANGWETDHVLHHSATAWSSPTVKYTPKVPGRELYRPSLSVSQLGNRIMAHY